MNLRLPISIQNPDFQNSLSTIQIIKDPLRIQMDLSWGVSCSPMEEGALGWLLTTKNGQGMKGTS
jgi:hypothetical protein